MEIVELDAAGIRAAADDLAAVLTDCVDGGASVSFMAPFTHHAALGFFRETADAAERGDTILLAARSDKRVIGTVQLGIGTPPNQPHRADVKKLLVLRSARKQGIGAALMTRLEHAARARGRTLLVLDTASGDAARLYESLGWTRAGIIPDYALYPDGRPCDTVIYWKRLDGS
ncbi:MAG TPA: GNAT family N-acetyltransferase [Xanthobacteraceae bacterium]|nr:GNAT family N-acetyltransferase [Xanthobacteraceae bacterium]